MGNRISPQTNQQITDISSNLTQVPAPRNNNVYIVNNNEFKLNTTNFQLSSTVETEEDKDKWYPNDALYNQYSSMSRQIAQYQSLNSKLKKLIERKKNIESYLQTKKPEHSDPVSRLNYLSEKEELINTNNEIENIEKEIKKINDLQTTVIDQWEEYYDYISNFIKKNDLGSFVQVSNLLTSSNIVSLLQYINGSILRSDVSKEEVHNKIMKLNKLINLKKVVGAVNERKILTYNKINTYMQFNRLQESVMVQIQDVVSEDPTEILQLDDIPSNVQPSAPPMTNQETIININKSLENI